MPLKIHKLCMFKPTNGVDVGGCGVSGVYVRALFIHYYSALIFV